MNENISTACACRNMHFGCNVATCEQAQYANRSGNASLKQYRRCAAERGCQTCLTVVNALLIPEIKSVWQDSITQALSSGESRIIPGITEDDDEVDITVETPQRLTGACENDKCKAFLPRSCQPFQRTDSGQNLEHLKYWLRICDQTHSRCLKEDNTESPTRLLKLTEGQVKLVETCEGEKVRYMTLSHRWGLNETFKLTKANILNAIRITRDSQINYIWIDSLCIIQDDAGDWGIESIRMRTVYCNSYLNIAACHARDSNGDIFSSSDLTNRFPRHSVPGSVAKYIRQQPYWTHTDYGSSYTDRNNQQVLLSRGWVLQERTLSPRIVYYDADELKWECNMTTDCQRVDYMAGLEGSRGPRSLSVKWMLLVQRYSRLNLTYDTDRVVALTGMLCWWINDTHRKVERYVCGAVNFVHHESRYDTASFAAEIMEVECNQVNNQIGVTTGGFLKVNGKWIRLLARIHDLGSETKPPSYRLVNAKMGIKFSVHFTADYIKSAEQATTVQNVLLLF
ncbi:heterokaryon incompatibility protein-domain-containing protein [Xylaria venustula]|nr:heterokaryon incompatibility protein-domain-containing protein [Xylaria venustula]